MKRPKITTVENSLIEIKGDSLRRIKRGRVLGGYVSTSIPDTDLNKYDIFPGKNTYISNSKITAKFRSDNEVHVLIDDCNIIGPGQVQIKSYYTDNKNSYLSVNSCSFQSILELDTAIRISGKGNSITDSIINDNAEVVLLGQSQLVYASVIELAKLILKGCTIENSVFKNYASLNQQCTSIIKDTMVGGKAYVLKCPAIINSAIGDTAIVSNSEIKQCSLIGSSARVSNSKISFSTILNESVISDAEYDDIVITSNNNMGQIWQNDIWNSIKQSCDNDSIAFYKATRMHHLINTHPTKYAIAEEIKDMRSAIESYTEED